MKAEPQGPTCPCTMVVFGASGDLTRRKLMPALFNLERDGLLHDHFQVVGYARSEKDDETFRREMRSAVEAFSLEAVPGGIWNRFSTRLHYLSGRYDEAESLGGPKAYLAELVGPPGAAELLYYFALPPGGVES